MSKHGLLLAASISGTLGFLVVGAGMTDAFQVGKYALLSLVLAAAAVLALLDSWRILRKKRKRLSDRENLSEHELYERYFRSAVLSRDEVLAFLRLVARESEQRVGQLRPTDRFDGELSPVPGAESDDGLDFIPFALQRRFGGSAEDYDLRSRSTLKELLAALREVCTKST